MDAVIKSCLRFWVEYLKASLISAETYETSLNLRTKTKLFFLNSHNNQFQSKKHGETNLVFPNLADRLNSKFFHGSAYFTVDFQLLSGTKSIANQNLK